MFRPRVIPVLLLKDDGLVKSINYKNHRYIGDPINAVKIFNDLRADELALLDISATLENRLISIDFVRKVGDESNMPFSVGGGIKNIQNIRDVINAGAEKVIINSEAVINPKFIKSAAENFGSSTVTISIDIKKNFFKKKKIYVKSGTKSVSINPLEFAKKMEDYGAGEIIINSIDKDGMMNGYDLETINSISSSVSIPVIASCGAGNLKDFKKAILSNASAVAAGSLFVYHGPRKGILINYPENNELINLFK